MMEITFETFKDGHQEITIAGQRYLVEPADEALPLFEAIWQPYLQRFLEAGFTVRFEHIELKRSALTVVIAEKNGLE